MKITCPKCQSSYRVDLPDPGEAGIDVQCGKCLHIFLFTSDIKKPGSSVTQEDSSAGTWDSDPLEGDSTSDTILPPQKDEGQEVSASNEPPHIFEGEASSLLDEDLKTPEEPEFIPISEDQEPIEIVVEDDTPEESLEEVALEDIWDQAVREGARTMGKSKKQAPVTPSEEPVAESVDEETAGEPPAEKKRLPSLEDRQREIDQMIADHQAEQKESAGKLPEEISKILADPQDPPPDKTQEEIDLEEQVVINEEEVMPDWEEAFLDQSKVEEGWQKAQEQDRILEEQQLSDALGKKSLPDETTPEEAPPIVPQGDRQSLVDEIFAQAKSQEEIDLEEQVTVDEKEVMPSWEEAFADQSEVETRWGKAQEKDRIHEEQQLADALGEEYVPSESTAEQTSATAMPENKQDLVDQLFEEVRSQQETGEPSETFAQDESLEVSGDQAPSSETQETRVEQHTIPGAIDLMTDLDDLNMKQLVTEAFKEESESQEETESSVPEAEMTGDEAVQEPELTMESMAETLQSEEEPQDDLIPELEMEAEPELTLEPVEEEEPEPAKAMTQEEEPEAETISELTLESAEEEPEPVEAVTQEDGHEATLELESRLDSAETQEEVEALIAEIPIEMESAPEPEPTPEPPEKELDIIEAMLQEEPVAQSEPELPPEPVEEAPEFAEAAAQEEELELPIEAYEETAASPEAQPVTGQKSILDDDEAIWDDLLLEHHEEEPPVKTEAPATVTGETAEEAVEENDFWDQVLEKDPPEPQTAETGQQPASAAQGTAGRETLTDEELWKQAFPGEDELEPAASDSGEEETFQSEPTPLVIGASIAQNEGSEDSLKYDEAAYADYDDDDDEFEFERRKRKLGPFVIPHGRRGDLVIGGAMVAFLLIAGSVYFTLQTFAPGELTDMQKAETEIPEGLTPREVPLEELTGLTPKPEKTPAIVDTPGDKGEAVLSDPSKILEASPEEKGILKDLAESEILKDTGKTQTAKIDQSALQAFTGNSITMSTIMPVAYNPTDIRVLSFSVEIQLSDAKSAKRVRESMPVYEDIMNQTVEDFLRRKFYNDILYVKEKLQKRLQTAMNRSLKNGRVKKAKFTDFAIQ